VAKYYLAEVGILSKGGVLSYTHGNMPNYSIHTDSEKRRLTDLGLRAHNN